MSSQRRIDSSRANGARSRGPVTPKGRSRSRAAGPTHGLTARQLVLGNESQEEFHALREAYLEDYQPQTRRGFDLIDQLAAIRWRHNRVLSLQTALLDLQMSRQEPKIRAELEVCDPETRIAIAFRALCDNSCALGAEGSTLSAETAAMRRYGAGQPALVQKLPLGMHA